MATGRKYAGEKFPVIKTEEDVVRELEEQRTAQNNPDMVDLTTFFAVKGITDTVKQSAMLAFTVKRKATFAEWDEVFKDF